jgi:hypothetical protein
VERCLNSLVVAALGTFMAAVRRSSESQDAVAALDSTEVRRTALGGTLEDDGRFGAIVGLTGPASDWWVQDLSRTIFFSHGMEWELAIEGPDASPSPARVGLCLLGGSKKCAKYEIGLVSQP